MAIEIKFRAWMVTGYDRDDNSIWEMIDGDSLAFDEYAPVCDLLKDKPDEAFYMQFTGLKDKNGKEIYEGDILKYSYNRDLSGKDIITFYEPIEWCDDVEWSGFNVHKMMNHEVVGNIYENPELLNTEQNVQASEKQNEK